jgi:hypothetical protein
MADPGALRGEFDMGMLLENEEFSIGMAPLIGGVKLLTAHGLRPI